MSSHKYCLYVVCFSASESQSTSDEPAKPVRRSRGPKPKPNLTQTSRHTRTQTQHKTGIIIQINKPLLSKM